MDENKFRALTSSLQQKMISCFCFFHPIFTFSLSPDDPLTQPEGSASCQTCHLIWTRPTGLGRRSEAVWHAAPHFCRETLTFLSLWRVRRPSTCSAGIYERLLIKQSSLVIKPPRWALLEVQAKPLLPPLPPNPHSIPRFCLSQPAAQKVMSEEQ